MIYKYPKNLSYQNYISDKIQFINKNDYNKAVSIQNIKKDEILIIESSQFNFCLLYTSPSPRDRQKSRMPSSA